MALPMKPLPEHPDLDDLIKKSVAAYNAMTPEQKREMRRAQRKSWVIGEMMLENPEMSREYAECIYASVDQG
jgi:hypothetical protein